MSEARNVWVFIEQGDGQVADVSLELLSKACELAQHLGSQVWALLCGYQVEGLVETVIQHGADHVLLADHPELEVYRTLPYCRVAVGLVKQHQPYIFLIGASPVGRDLAPRIASAVRVGLTADCTDLQIGDFLYKKENTLYKDLLYQIRPAFGGNIIATIVNPKTRPQMASVREGVMRRRTPDPSRQGTVEAVRPGFQPQDFALQVLSHEMRPPTVRLKDAPVIVAGGAGVDGPGEFELIQDLANLLGGEVGASRAAVDAGLVSREHQVGQTGLTVRPRLYIAAGISGAVQHRAGMDKSNKIIAINTDPTAPIFQVAHYKIVGDLAEVLPLLIKTLREKAK
ncbi:MAG TPA: electron transfer flavoprotein subunit alpha/FixB family protein [Anaerolineales bacterium]|nr:electron transfer flavoprotein subunit alpha/FixB family protein [Anaerolineales bacterium]